ncbi:MAG: hypothetical protein HN576_02630 [Bacteriovoracaceae bacterium]|jgi:hypothetical protein|nr:hypothetical protein [Bacteriovoracaceae bacterium]
MKEQHDIDRGSDIIDNKDRSIFKAISNRFINTGFQNLDISFEPEKLSD